MKKKIILFLSVLVIAMFLTGCGTVTISTEDIKSVDNVANETTEGIKGYINPMGYYVHKDKESLAITSKTEEGNIMVAEYDISTGVAQRTAITISLEKTPRLSYVVVGVICSILGILSGGLIVSKKP